MVCFYEIEYLILSKNKIYIMYNDSPFLDTPTNPLAVIEPQREPHRYTLTEYLRREERSNELHEYYDGIITKLPMARGPQNDIIVNMATTLKTILKAAQKTYYVRSGQQAIYLPKLNFSLYPDVIVVSETPQYFDKNEVLLINPLLIVEVLSKGTRKYDRTTKFEEYKTLDSFKEYVLIDPKKCHIQTRFREERNLWRETDYEDKNDIILLNSLQISIPIVDIYDNIIL
jgi:Uma2 family endonuclease